MAAFCSVGIAWCLCGKSETIGGSCRIAGGKTGLDVDEGEKWKGNCRISRAWHSGSAAFSYTECTDFRMAGLSFYRRRSVFGGLEDSKRDSGL